MNEITKLYENAGIERKRKLAIILDKILIAILLIITVPFVLVFEGSNRIFQFLADFNQKCSEILTDNIASGIYHFITDLIIKVVEDNQ